MKHIEQLDIANQSEYIVIKEAAEQIEKAYEPEKAVHTILSLISRQMGLNRGRVLLQENTSGYLYTAYAYGLTKEEIAQGRFAISEGISGKVMHSGSPIIVADIDREDDYLFRTVDRSTLPQETVAFIASPIVRNGVTVGVLAVNRLSKRPRSLDRDLSILKLMSLFISEILAVNAMIEQQTQYLKEENEQLRAMALGQGSQYGIIGESAALRSALNKVSRATNTAVTVLLKGESGTGKERFSRMLHLASHRQDGPFIAINCAAIPPDLLESELFGHEKGAFTGATQTKQGKIELANNGTLFLDEIGDLDFGLQAKLLRVLEERCVTRVGGTKQIHVDTRIIVASHKDLHEAVNHGHFRLDLFYRLNVFPIELPPLRERDGDIRLLARHFLNQANQEYHTSAIYDKGAMSFLETYEWPGNIHQLENVVKRAVLMADNGRLISAKLIEKIIQEESAIIHGGHVKPIENERIPPSRIEAWPPQQDSNHPERANPYPSNQNNHQAWSNTQPSTDDRRAYWPVSEDESDQLKQALEMARGNKTRAALLLNMTPRQFSYRMKKLAL
ncbi:MAG: sigma-54-dependent Fis family transcriptional regulator [Piscirickettsiaceae bacterium CG_4_9_14_3_um_filter_43_564]|nr:GAF domain-containing protein [Thiomicrospira sp.]OIP96242.1 MAG: sigma-54-dependent Fis family transcriptional regulator [Thiomicrospira sp. CG2_30_44_34]PIQ02515.1 MAG: sigma-54-dependent Fis family transcriptional regulator [Piscirickettsiaceae bacterium CG18_big_fil_WC_8_21_14_2_50_44_103]PIU37653.1 MAG: sigma-54-dependent Fis family transcriptional regulator [Piscirickettsiaceae bacterium CG07_land_8_20_14_0_80_44_28]PIW57910.1 MAG: sigma-54-dependent Fis family transcriptional regulato